MRKKKVLFLIHTLGVGGAEKVLLTLLKNMDKKKFDITVKTIVDFGPYVDDVKKMDGVKYETLFKYYFGKTIKKNKFMGKVANFIMQIIWAMYKMYIKYFYNERSSKNFFKEKYDLEIAFLEGMSAKIISKSHNKESKKIVWIHTDILSLSRASKAFKNVMDEKKCYLTFDKIICVSEEVKKSFEKKLEIYDNIITQINPIDTYMIVKQSEQLVEDIKRPKGLLLCSVGRLSNEKGYKRLLWCHKKLIDDGLFHTLWIIGEGNEREELENFIEENNLQNTVKLLGFKDNPYKYIKECDIFVLSSYVEGFSTVLCEAITLNKPIVSTNCPGVIQIVGENEKAGIVTENDDMALYKGLKEMIENLPKLENFKNIAKKRSAIFNLDRQVERIENIFEEVLRRDKVIKVRKEKNKNIELNNKKNIINQENFDF